MSDARVRVRFGAATPAMPASLEHDALVDLFRQHPNLVPALLVTALGIAVPQDATVAIVESTLDELNLPELRADLVVEVRSGAELELAVVLEVQLGNDPAKGYSWPAYVALVRARRRCRACVLVVAPDAAVAAWAARPIELGPGSVVAPLVLGPERIPRVADPDVARRDPPLAVLSARAHGNDPDGLPLLLASLSALEGLDSRTRDIYLFIIYDALREPMRSALETAMTERFTEQTVPRPPFVDQLLERGRVEGREEGRQEGRQESKREFLGKLLSRNAPLTEQQRRRLEECRDLTTLDRWIDRALAGAPAAEILAPD